MRTVRLGRQFDGIFVHDAIMYMLTEIDARLAIETAATDTSYTVDYAYLLREGDGSVRVEWDRHIEGLFPRTDWLRWLDAAGFDVTVVPFEPSDLPPGEYEVFACRRRR